MDVIEKLQSSLVVKMEDLDPENRGKIVIQAFDFEFTNFLDVASIQAQEKKDAQMFDLTC